MIIKTPSRLHMTLIDLNGEYGRLDGGIGLTIAKPNLVLKGEPSKGNISVDFNSHITDKNIRDTCNEKILSSASKLLSYYGIKRGFHFTVEEFYPPHSGLGSGTQISLATAKLIHEHLKKDQYASKLDNFDSEISISNLGKIIGRGGTSGIGIFSFEHGGFIIDGGHSLKEKKSFSPSSASTAKPPSLIGTYNFPKEWDIVIAIPNADTSVTGMKELDLFKKYCPVPKRDVEKLSHLILMNLLPFLLEKDIESFGNVINHIQNLGFKKVEIDLQPEKVKSLMAKMHEAGAYGVGMSSFGPTVYAITCENTTEVYNSAKEAIGNDGIVFITKAQNHGYELQE
ncbi:homoserine kinase [Methanobrevibacter cuticularis]|uniref:Beta-ribofuranosylaminobenzene 5'-phosphate synthase n=1 Tax=Methanobrevibacter cuticularis TaxID=47311 RepID=A0A166D073_9EURY|nr:beta-ribofuranosylaminobenzene 5'-phosphate synthase [Methanobrevibacter cuticularis]KZX15061.1 homoserine kinase [Methanobrevibacter cuticularis]